MEVIFRFEIGEIVIFRKAITENAVADPTVRPILYMIVERMIRQCPGGTQVNYLLGGHKDWTNEIELAKLGDFDFAASRTKAIQDDIDTDAKKEDALIAQYQKRKDVEKTE